MHALEESGDSEGEGPETINAALFPHSETGTWLEYFQTVLRIAVNKHRACLFLTVYFWLCIHWMAVETIEDKHDTISLWNTLCLVYLLYVYECYKIDKTHKYIDNGVMDKTKFEEYTYNIMMATSALRFHGNHSYGSSALDRSDDTTEYTYVVENVTDKSHTPHIASHVTKVRCSLEWSVWSDSDGHYHKQREEFIACHESAFGAYRNTFRDALVISGTPCYDRLIVYSDEAHLPLPLRNSVVRGLLYYAMLFGGVLWAYRVWFDSVMKSGDFRVHKAMRFK